MSRNSSSAAIKRDDAVADEPSPQAVTVSRQDLTDLAAMLARVEALIAADVTPELGGSDVIERIADIAFVLHERDVEASLCDALDASVREIGAAGAFKKDRARRAHQATEVLRELSQRINHMIALSEARHSEPPGAANRIEDELPRAVAPLRGSLPSPAPAVGLALGPQSKANVGAAPPSEHIQQTKLLGGQGAAAVNMADGATEPRSSTATVELSVEPAAEAFLDEDILLPTTASETALPNKPVLNEVSSGEAPSGEIPPSREPALGSASPTEARGEFLASKKAPQLLNPEDDPGDLFEPTAGIQPSAPPELAIETAVVPSAPEIGRAPVPEHTGEAAEGIFHSEDDAPAPLAAGEAGSLDAGSPVESSNPLRQLRFTAAIVPPSVLRPEPTDPLAPVRALSNEEMIALFS
jgi:hypothetical protein